MMTDRGEIEFIGELPATNAAWKMHKWDGGIVFACPDHQPLLYKDGFWYHFIFNDRDWSDGGFVIGGELPDSMQAPHVLTALNAAVLKLIEAKK